MSDENRDSQEIHQVMLYHQHGLQSMADIPMARADVVAAFPSHWIKLEFIDDSGKEVTQLINPDHVMVCNVLPAGTMRIQHARAANVDPKLIAEINRTKAH